MATINKENLIQLWKKIKSYVEEKLKDYPSTEQLPQAIEEALAGKNLPNPNSLVFTGAVSAEYDGSAPVTVEIPEGGSGASGGGSEYTLLSEFEVGTSFNARTIIDLATYSCNEFYVVCSVPKIANESFVIGIGDTTSQTAFGTSQYAGDVFAHITNVNGKYVGFAGWNHGWSGFTGHGTGAVSSSPRSSEGSLSKLFLYFSPYNAEETLVATCKLYGR